MDALSFRSTDFQSALQLAAAINLGLGVFQELRAPAEGQVRRSIEALMDATSASQKKWENLQRKLEANSRASDEFTHAAATDKMVQSAEANSAAIDIWFDFSKSRNKWSARDRRIQFSALIALLAALMGLGFTTVMPQLDTANIRIWWWIFLALSIFVYWPLGDAMLLFASAYRELSSTFGKRLDKVRGSFAP